MQSRSRIKRLSAITGLILCYAVICAKASAIVVSTAGDAFTVNFNGIVRGEQHLGLTSYATFTLRDVQSDESGGQNWSFDITLFNTSSGDITASRVSVLGFDSTAPINIKGSSAEGLFDRASHGNMPAVGSKDICFKATGGKNCAGGGGGGVVLGDNDDFSIILNIDSVLNTLELDNFSVRYQSIDGIACGDSGIGEGTVVPIPAAAWLMGSALLGLFGVSRRSSSARNP